MHFKYRKPFGLSARRDPYSGKLSGNIIPRTQWPENEPSVIMLIHGFNTDEKEADQGYADLLLNMRKAGFPDHFMPRVCQFYWPGNLSNFLSRPSYFVQVKKAMQVAGLLADYLQKLPRRKTEITFIGHSLGCRLILETFSLIMATGSDRISVKSTQLLAAAVSVPMVSPNGRLAHLGVAKQNISGIYSDQDSVLRKWFPLGQWAAGEGYDEAVGLKGKPETFWTNTAQSWNEHDDYWKNQMTADFLTQKLDIPTKRNLHKKTPPTKKIFSYKTDNTRKLKQRSIL